MSTKHTMVRTVVATGVFEVIHPGHVLYLTEARKLGDRLVVIVARDVNVAKWKRIPHIPEDHRVKVVAALKPVDEAVLGEEEAADFYTPIERIRPDVIALGPNQDIDEAELRKELEARGIDADIIRITKRWDNPLASTRSIISKIRGT